jgi:co-chaperonin GroES (HSP10)
MKVTPIGTNVVIQMSSREEMTSGGIAIPTRCSEPSTEGVILAVGGKVETVSEGDTVGFPAHLGTRFESREAEGLIIDEAKLLYVRE